MRRRSTRPQPPPAGQPAPVGLCEKARGIVSGWVCGIHGRPWPCQVHTYPAGQLVLLERVSALGPGAIGELAAERVFEARYTHATYRDDQVTAREWLDQLVEACNGVAQAGAEVARNVDAGLMADLSDYRGSLLHVASTALRALEAMDRAAVMTGGRL